MLSNNNYSATNLPKLPIGLRKIKKLQFKPEKRMFAYHVLIIQQGKSININLNVIIKSLLTLLQSQNNSDFSVLFCLQNKLRRHYQIKIHSRTRTMMKRTRSRKIPNPFQNVNQ